MTLEKLAQGPNILSCCLPHGVELSTNSDEIARTKSVLELHTPKRALHDVQVQTLALQMVLQHWAPAAQA